MIRISIGLLLVFILGLGACNVTQKIKDGDTAFERKQYAVAIDFLKDEFERARQDELRAYKAFRLGLSYERINDPQSAIPWYRQAYDYGFGVEALSNYARLLQEDQQYTNAIKAYDVLLDQFGTNRSWGLARRSCVLAREWIKNQNESPYQVTLAEFNSPSAEYAPVYFEDGSVIFTSDRSDATGGESYNWTGRSYSDFFQVYPGRSEVEPFIDRFNSKYNDGTISFSPDYTEAYFSRCIDENGGDDYCQIYYSRKEGNLWTVPIVMPFTVSGVNYGHPSVLFKGDALIFSAQMEEGMGGYDLYMVYRRGNTWLDPFMLPGSINTEGNEMFPTIHNDTLYFASDGHPGMGGLDIFKTYQISPDNWAGVENLRAPVNSGGDDFNLAVDPFFRSNAQVKARGMFTSSREDGSGNDDIYYFSKRIIEEKIDTTAEKRYRIRVVGSVSEQLYADNSDPDSPKMGTRPLANSTVRIKYGGSFDFLQVDAFGQFEYELEPGFLYEFSASGDSLLTTSGTVNTTDDPVDLDEDITYVLDLVLDRIFYNREVVMENIYYDFNKWDIRPDAEPTLDELVLLLNDNPTIRIELGSHTDCRSSDSYNLGLSQRRAQSAVNYLIDQGVDPLRMRAVGYGETRLKVDCPCEECTEEQHQENRRTTFKIVD